MNVHDIRIPVLSATVMEGGGTLWSVISQTTANDLRWSSSCGSRCQSRFGLRMQRHNRGGGTLEPKPHWAQHRECPYFLVSAGFSRRLRVLAPRQVIGRGCPFPPRALECNVRLSLW